MQVIKLNPYKEVYTGTKKFAWKGQEQTFIRFSMKNNGDYWKMTDLPKNLVLRPSGTASSSSGDGTFSSYNSMGGPSGPVHAAERRRTPTSHPSRGNP